MTTLAQLRKNKSAMLAKVTAAMDAQKNGSGGGNDNDDVRFWRPTRDAAGNGSAVIRFLPPMNDVDELPWVTVYSRAFKYPKTQKWYINNDLSTIGRNDDPVYKYVSENDLYATNKELATKMGRKTHFISNVYIIRDPGNPANNGTVKLFKYGKSIFDMIQNKANPKFEDDTAIDVFDLDEGANFRLRIVEKDGYPNYDQSTFDNSSAFLDGDEQAIQGVIDSYIGMYEFIDPNNTKRFKTPEALQKELDRALGKSGGAVGSATEDSESGKSSKKKQAPLDDDDDDDTPPSIPERKPKADSAAGKQDSKKSPPWDDEEDDIPVPTPKKETKKSTPAPVEDSSGDDDDDDLEEFRKMVSR